MKERYKPGRDLRAGDRIVLHEGGKVLTIRALYGMVRDSRVAEFTKGDAPARVFDRARYRVVDDPKK